MFIEVTLKGSTSAIPVNINHIMWVDQDVATMSTGDLLTLEAESLQRLLSIILPRKKNVKDNSAKPELQELFEELHKLTGGKGKTVFTLGREKKLNDLLTKHRMTRDNLITAATNIGRDAFLQGENDSKKRYGDIDYLLRPDKAAKWSEEQVEKKKSMF